MLKPCSNVLILCVLALCCGCAPAIEFSKTVWGSSTRALEEARVNGIVRTYDAAVGRCYDEVLKLLKDNDNKETKLKIFIQNKPKATIVVMGIPGSVNTTEVGIFFAEMTDNKTKIYISSLSSNAKRIVAEKIFPRLDTILGVSDNQEVTVIEEQ